jgi:exopolysaccharide biosynthesis polyprenyl glycosylphosphotransferase
MLRRQRQIRTQLSRLLDASLFAVSFWLAHIIRQDNALLARLGGPVHIQPFASWTVSYLEQYAPLLLVIVLVSPLLLEIHGFYGRPLVQSRRRTLWQLSRGCALTVLVVVVVMFLLNQKLARSVIILFGLISFGLVWGKEELLRCWVASKMAQAQMRKRLILLGTTEDTARLQKHLAETNRDGIEILAELNLNETPIDELVHLLHEHSANGVILSAKHTYFGKVEKAIQACELEGVEAWLMADFFNTQLSQTSLDDFYGRPMLVFRSTPEDSWQALAKEMLDLAGAFVLLLLSSPIFLLTALAIKITSPGPILFRQQRSGLNGRPFTMLKFRSMVTDAEQLKQELAQLNEMAGPVFKLAQDPRVTPVGRIIRRFSIDELPQLVNVLRGEMSLVGPRPLPVDEVKRFDDLSHRRRLSVKPGLTCLWQVSGRNDVKDFRDWVRLDLEYIDNWSFWLDLKILLRTVPVVLMGTGAR